MPTVPSRTGVPGSNLPIIWFDEAAERGRSLIDLAKLRDYCLNPFHPRGKHKARVFFDALGLTAANASLLASAILAAVPDADANHGEIDQHGQRYSVDLDVSMLGKTARLRTAWILRTGERRPRLTTCYVL